MTQFFYLLAIIFGSFMIAFTLINLRYWVIGKEFRGTCANASAQLKSQIGECVVCGRKPGEDCAAPSKA
ncbi:MAG: hypothetical protein ABI844_13535 [Saprospiraceae bacterium]